MATTTFNDLITFSRGSNATVTGPNGLIQWAPSNLLTNSQDFEASAWSKNNGTVAANVTAAPDGTLTADKFVENTSNSSHFIIQSATTIATSYTFSVYAKAAGRTFVLVYHDQSNSGAVFNLTNGAITTPSGIPLAAASVTDAGNGWYRCAITVTATAASNGFRAQLGDSATNYVYTGDGTSGIFIWGAQLELGSTATTYNNTSVRNLLGFSEASDNAAWTKIGTSIVTGAQANPVNGLFNAQKLMEDTANSGHQINQGATTTANPFTFSTYAKPAGRNWMALGITDSGSTVRISYFDLANGVTGTVASGVTASIVSVGNGWYRCAVTVAAAAAGANTLRIYATNANNITSYTGDGNSGVYIYGAQLSNSASLDPYVPTPGAAPSSTAYYGPRFDYDPVTLLPRGLLVEEARTNQLTYSDQFDNAAWSKVRITVTANANTSPDGTLNADTLTGSGGGTTSLSQIMYATGGSHTATIYAKAGTKSVIQFSANTFAWGVDARANFDLQLGTLGTVDAGLTASIQNVGSGWYRCSVTATKAASAGALLWCIVDSPTAAREAAATAGTLLTWGAQLEAGAFATSYIPTIASTVTRSADVATITGSLFSQWYNQPEGSFVLEADTFKPTTVSAGSFFALNASDGTTAEQANIRFAGTNVGGLVWDGGVLQAGMDTSYAANTPEKYALALRTNDFAFARNGAAPSTDTSGTLPTVSRLSIGTNATASSEFINGHIRSIRYVPVRAADFQLQALTELPLVPTLDLDFLNSLYEA
jgi:hypothetical protein